MATLLDLITDVRAHLDEATATYWGEEELKVWIFEAMRDIARRAEVLADTFAYDVINGKEAYDLPSDMLRIHRVEYRQTTDNTWALEFRPILEMDDAWLKSRTSTGTPNYYCVDPETEILTRDGFRTYSQIEPGQLILAIDPQTGLAHWEALRRVAIFEQGPEEMISMEGNGHSSLTTPNHRWLIRARSGNASAHWYQWRFRETENLCADDQIPAAVPVMDLPTDPKYTDAFVEAAAWAWTEGGLAPDRRYVSIAQSERANPDKVLRIRACLRLLQGQTTEFFEANQQMVQFSVRQELGRALQDVVPEHRATEAFINSLTEAQLRLFLETSVDGDGHRLHGKYLNIHQKERSRLDPIQMACQLLGLRSHLFQSEGMWRLAINRRTFFGPIGAARHGLRWRIKKVPYNGMVWCPETPSGTWLARRRGTTYFTGNTIWGFAGGSQQLRLWPIPSENISDGLILYYYRLPRKPQDNNDPIDLPAGWEDLIPLYVSVNAFLKDKDFRWRDTKALYEQRLAEMIQVTRHPTDQQTFISASGMFGSYSDWNF